MNETASSIETTSKDFVIIKTALTKGVSSLTKAVDWVLEMDSINPRETLAGAVPLLMLFGTVAGGWLMARAALAAYARIKESDEDAAFFKAKIGTALFYAGHILSQASGLASTVTSGAEGTLALDDAQFAA